MASNNQEEIVPTELDVLCGKTKKIINHPGTIRYQRVVESYTQRYIQAESKFDKMTVTKNLYDYLKTTSRFLKWNEKQKGWEEITALAARDKVGHALRFAVNNVNSEKRRMKSKRGHRRVGSDWSAASATSISSAVSSNTANTATSDGPGVQSLMQALAASMNFADPNAPGTNTTRNSNFSGHPLRASTDGSDHPLWSSMEDKKHPLLPNHSSSQHPLMVSTPSNAVQAVISRSSSPGSDNSPHSTGRPLFTPKRPLPSLQVPPLEVVTKPQSIRFEGGTMSDDFLSMLQEPIYELDVEDPNDDLF